MLPHLSRPKTLRILAGVACVAVSGAAGALLARQPEAPPPAVPTLTAPPVLDPVPAPLVSTPVSAPPAPAKRVAISELTLARSVLLAIDDDPVLKDVNLIVSVVDRGAVVGGPVTSEDIKKRVEMVVRGVPGVESVKNVCFVQTDADPLLRAMAERLKPDTKPAPPGPLPGLAVAPTAPPGFLPPIHPDPLGDPLPGTRNTVVALQPALPPVSVLGAPVAVAPPGPAKAPPRPAPAPAAPLNPAAPPAPGALTGTIPAAKPTGLPAAAAAVRDSDPRFARLTVELKPDGVLFVSGWCAATADVRDFRTELRKIPGVGRILVDPALVK